MSKLAETATVSKLAETANPTPPRRSHVVTRREHFHLTPLLLILFLLLLGGARLLDVFLLFSFSAESSVLYLEDLDL